MDIGTCLRESRERRDIALRHVADVTKLSISTLRHIEQNAFDRLPGGAFTTGYLRAYAETVGVEPGEIVREYLVQYPRIDERDSSEGTSWRSVRPGRGLVAPVVAILTAAVLHTLIPGPETRPIQATRLKLPQNWLPVGAPGVVDILSDSSPVGGHDEASLAVDIQPTATCWVSALADGRVVLSELLRSGDRVRIIAHHDLVLRVGAPEAFAFSINGRRGRALGEAGRPVTVTMTDTNYETFVSTASQTWAAHNAPL